MATSPGAMHVLSMSHLTDSLAEVEVEVLLVLLFEFTGVLVGLTGVETGGVYSSKSTSIALSFTTRVSRANLHRYKDKRFRHKR